MPRQGKSGGESTRSEAANLVHQTRLYTDSRFQAILEQITALADDPVILQLLSKKAGEITPQDYLAVQSHVDTIRLYNSSIIDRVYIDRDGGGWRRGGGTCDDPQGPPQVVVLDIRMPFMDGLELAKHTKEAYPDIKFIFLTGYEDFSYAKRAIDLQAVDYLLKLSAAILVSIGKIRRPAISRTAIRRWLRRSTLVRPR